jgi:zona occludens toxin (predicted ATPase)
MAFATPKITKVRSEIRGAAEAAYKHKNLSLLGIRGFFMQSMHLAEDNGNASEMYTSKFRWLPKWVFRCYESTATGAFKDSGVGSTLLANPSLLFVLVCGAAAAFFALRSPLPTFLRGSSSPTASVAGPGSASGGTLAGDDSRPVARVARALPVTARRVVGVVQMGEGGFALLYASGQYLRIPLTFCRRAEYTGWVCAYDGETVTESTGASPPDMHLEGRPHA